MNKKSKTTYFLFLTFVVSLSFGNRADGETITPRRKPPTAVPLPKTKPIPTKPIQPNIETEAKAIPCKDCSPLAVPIPELVAITDALHSTVLGKNCQDKRFCEEVLPWAQERAQRFKGCRDYFINEAGQIGKLSKLVVEQIVADIDKTKLKDDPTKSTSVFLQKYPDIDKICPGFETMNTTDKISFWAYFFEILGFLESSCNPDKLNNGENVPNGPATGLYQLEPTEDIRGWRGANCKGSQKDILIPENNTACAIDIVKWTLNRNKRLFGLRNKDDKRVATAYWESLNPLKNELENRTEDPKLYNLPHTKMKRFLSRFPLCTVGKK